VGRVRRHGSAWRAWSCAGLVVLLVVVHSGFGAVSATVTQASVVTLVAGNGTFGYSSGSGNVATTAAFGDTWAVGDAAGNYYTTEYSTCHLRKVSMAGLVSDVAGTASCGYGGDNGPASAASLSGPMGLVRDSAGNLVFADSQNCLVRRIDAATGIISTIAGTVPDPDVHCGFAGDNGPATSAQLNTPKAIAIDASGTVYIADGDNCRVRAITAGTIKTVAGGETCGYGGDNGPATSAQLSTGFVGVAVDSAGTLYISDSGNQRIRKVTSPLASGTITTIAGTGAPGLSGDGGSALLATMNTPHGLSVGPNGTVFFADMANCRVRSIAGGSMYTAAGSSCGNSGDRGSPTSARFAWVSAATLTPGGDLVISDAANYQIKVVNRVSAPSTTSGAVASGLQNDWRTYGNSNISTSHWTGGDGVFSYALANGTVVWLFADSYVGTGTPGSNGYVNADHSRQGGSLAGFVSSQVVIENPFTVPATYTNKFRDGAIGQPYFPNPDSSHVYWPSAPFLRDNGNLTVFLRSWHKTGPSTGTLDGIAVSTIPLLNYGQPSTPVLVPDAFPHNPAHDADSECDSFIKFGESSIVQTEGNQKYTYIFGTDSCGFSSTQPGVYSHVARIAGTDVAGTPWTYWDGSTWADDPATSGRLKRSDGSPINDLHYEYSVVKTATGYRMISTHAEFSLPSSWNKIGMYTATSITGPYAGSPTDPAAKIVYTMPETGRPAYNTTNPSCVLQTYNAKEHPAFEYSNDLVLSYNVAVAAGCPDNVANPSTNVDNYRPRFVTVSPAP